MDEKVKIGRITTYHGLKGCLKMYPYFDFPERVSSLKDVFVDDNSYTIEEAKRAGTLWLVKLQGLNSRDDAELLKGKEISIPADERFPLPEGHYYVDDIVGLKVYEDTGRYLGLIREILHTGANDIYVINCPPEDVGLPKEILFPALKQLVVSVSLKEKKVVVKTPEGLY